MFILTVIPIKKGVGREYLSYFAGEHVQPGTIVSVPVRSRTIDAIVIEAEPAENLKSSLRSLEYQIKKITKIKGPSPFTPEFFDACVMMKDYAVSTTGAVISALLPQSLIENANELVIPQKKETAEESPILKSEQVIFQALTPDRISWYRTLIREVFAKKQSIFICVPTRYDIERIKEALTKGIEQYVFAFDGSLSKKTLIQNYNACLAMEHPILIIGTGMFLSIPRDDIQTVIIEHESSDAYKQFGRPYLDIRTFAEVYAKRRGIKLILGDTLIRPETLHRHDQGELGEVASPLFRLPHVERQFVIDMKEERDTKGAKLFEILSDKTKKMIAYALEHNESVFLYSLRKGLAGITVCHDCGHTLLCPNCTTPIVLYGSKQRTATKTEGNRVFMCNKCGHKEITEIRCPDCTSWNLTPIGIGADRVYEAVKKEFPTATILSIDKESTPTEKEAREAIKTLQGNKGAILIGTELAFSYLSTPVTHSAIISLDGLLSIPSFNMTQKIIHIIEKLHTLTERNLIIQTRIPDNHILECILSGNVLPLYREDLRERKQFGYPPFRRLIKITFTGTAGETEKARAFLDTLLGEYDPQIFSAFVGKVRGQYVTNTVIKVDPTLWKIPSRENEPRENHLLSKLLELPPGFSINVDPEDLL
ncbi:MAG: hypothetical protein WC059_01925 [Candidatus Paceibacterota bacterium]